MFKNWNTKKTNTKNENETEYEKEHEEIAVRVSYWVHSIFSRGAPRPPDPLRLTPNEREKERKIVIVYIYIQLGGEGQKGPPIYILYHLFCCVPGGLRPLDPHFDIILVSFWHHSGIIFVF